MSDSATQLGQLATPQVLPPLTTDGGAVPSAVSSTPDPSDAGAPPPNPLDALEQILKDAKAKAGSASATESTPGVIPPVADEATRKAELAARAQEQGVEDSAAIDVQLHALEQVVESPAYIARVEQDTQKKQQDEVKKKQADDYAIIQLGHTKI